MPRRSKALAALLLAILVCLILVMPQVDLDNGILRDVPNQTLLLVFMGLAAALTLLMPPQSYVSQEAARAEDIPLKRGAYTSSILRC